MKNKWTEGSECLFFKFQNYTDPPECFSFARENTKKVNVATQPRSGLFMQRDVSYIAAYGITLAGIINDASTPLFAPHSSFWRDDIVQNEKVHVSPRVLDAARFLRFRGT